MKTRICIINNGKIITVKSVEELLNMTQNSDRVILKLESDNNEKAASLLTSVNISNSILSEFVNIVVAECVEKTAVKLKGKDHKFIVNFYRHVFNGLIIDWVSEGMDNFQ